MRIQYHVIIIVIVCVRLSGCVTTDLAICHEDARLNPRDGLLKAHTFPWLAIIPYEHVTTGAQHHSKAPRVVLIHKQFVLGTASDIIQLPKNYKLGLVIFGDYVQDEKECSLTKTQIRMGVTCARAFLEMPIADISAHPEFSRFGVGNSLAVVKLIRPLSSNYMVPICLPSINERLRKKVRRDVYLIDYLDAKPINFEAEYLMGKSTLKLFTHKECRRHRMKAKMGSEGVTHVLCSSGCGVRRGAPIISQSVTGTFELIGISASDSVCRRRKMRRRLNHDPPLYIDVFPYVTWIINILSAHLLPLPYPTNFQLTDGGGAMFNRRDFLRKRTKFKFGWQGRYFMAGDLCFKSRKKIYKKNSVFYQEQFEVKADPPGMLNIFMKISAGVETTIVCVRLGLPNRLINPLVMGVGGYNISIEFSTDWFPYFFEYTLDLLGRNSTAEDLNTWYPERSPGFF